MVYANSEYFYRSHSALPHLNQNNLPPAMPCPYHGMHQKNMQKAMIQKRRKYFNNKLFKMAKTNKQKDKNYTGKITHTRMNQQEAENTYYSDHYASEDEMQPTTLPSKATETNKKHISNKVENAIYIKISDIEYKDEFFVPESNLIHELLDISTLTFGLNEKSQVMQSNHSAKAIAYLLRLVVGEEHLLVNMETAIESYSIAMECDHEALRENLKKSIENDVLTDSTQVAYNPSTEIDNFYEAVAQYKLTDSDFGTRITFNQVLQLHWETVPSFHNFVKQSKLPCEFNIESKSLIHLHGIVLRCQLNETRGDTLKIICSIRIGSEDYPPIFESKDINSQIFVQFKNSVVIQTGEKATVCIMIDGRKHDIQQEFKHSDKDMSFVMISSNTENMDEKVYLEKILYHVE